MPFVKFNQAKQIEYMKLLHKKALEQAKLQDPPLFDPQGRLLVEVSLSRSQLKKIGLRKEGKELAPKTIVVSLDVNADPDLSQKFYSRVSDALTKALSETGLQKKLTKAGQLPFDTEKAIEALEKLPKGSVISLQQEYSHHLQLVTQVYQKSVPELEGQNLSPALEKALIKTNKLIMRHYALAVAQAYKEGNIDLEKLNKELDKARKEIANSAHRILRDEIRKQTGVALTEESLLKKEVDAEVAKQKLAHPKKEPDVKKIRNKLLTKIAEDTVASPHDLLHIDTRLGNAVWIEGSQVTAHDRHIQKPGDELATRQIIRHQIKDGVIIAYPTSRVQIRVPSLDAKSDASEVDHIEDVHNKISHINERYFDKRVPKPDFFVYNLYTSLEHTLDDAFKDNLQTQGARQILQGVHLYNASAIEEGKPLCLVQNIPINGFGSTLGYGIGSSKLVTEATLMTEIALMHSLLGIYHPLFQNINQHYKLFLAQHELYLQECRVNATEPDPEKSFFSQSEYGKEAIRIIQDEIKAVWKKDKTAPPQPERHADKIRENAKAYLRYIVANNLHHTDEYSKLTQTLSVFIEEHSIGGCKSANERAQAINGRVLMLDSLLIADPNAPHKDERHALMQALAKPHDPKGLKAALDGAYNVLGLQSAAALISFMDQGAAAKGLARLDIQLDKQYLVQGFNGNYFEESSLTNLKQNKAGAMQAHKGLAEKMMSACDDSQSEKLPQPQGVMKEVERDLEEQLGDYSSYGKAVGAPQTGQDFVNARLDEGARKHLYEGIDAYQNRHFALMVDYCNKFKLPIPDDSPDFFRKQFIEFCARKEFTDFAGDKGKRKTKPETATQSLEELFGKQGAALYKLALAEERHTKEYMNAVFQESTSHSEGNKWTTRPVIIVAGPSACGKSTAANAAIEQAKSALPTDPNNHSGNDIVAADGGVAREVSQMRKLAIQLAVEHGYSGIKDLHNKSNVLGDVKDCILEAAYATENLGVVIPETFSHAKTSASMFARIDQLKNTTPIWIRVTGENKSIFSALLDKITTSFREVVAYMGSRRAFKTSGFKDEKPEAEREDTHYDLNISKDEIPESKAYGGFLSFMGGWFGSWKAEQNFKKHYQDGITFTLVNDLILLKPGSDPKGPKWVQGQQNSEGVIMVSRTTYNAWLKSDAGLSLELYAKANRKALIYTDGQFALVSAMKALEAEYHKAPAGSPLKVFLNSIKSDLSDLNALDGTEKIKDLYSAIENFTEKHKSNSALTTLTLALDKRYHELRLVEHLKEGKKLSEEDAKLKSQWEKVQTAQLAVIDEQILARKPIEALKEALQDLQKVSFKSNVGHIVKKEDASPLMKDLAAISSDCEEHLDLLEKQREKLEALQEALADEFSPETLRGTLIRPEVMELMDKIDKQLEEIEQVKNDILLPLQKLVDGEGLTEQVGSAQTGELRHRVKSTFTITSQDKLLTDDALVQDYDEDLDEHNHAYSGTMRAEAHSSIAPLKEGNYREHTIRVTANDKPIAVITEIHHPNGLASDKNKEPSVTYTCKDNNAQTTEEKILKAFATASLMLGNLKDKPSKTNEITLNGNDKESLEFLFTALMVLGDKSTMKFNADAIRVRALVFDPTKELGSYGRRYSPTSCYAREFKQHEPLVNDLVNDFNRLLKNKSLHAEEQQTATTTLTHTTHKYKDRMGSLKGEVEVASQRLTN